MILSLVQELENEIKELEQKNKELEAKLEKINSICEMRYFTENERTHGIRKILAIKESEASNE